MIATRMPSAAKGSACVSQARASSMLGPNAMYLTEVPLSVEPQASEHALSDSFDAAAPHSRWGRSDGGDASLLLHGFELPL